MPPATGSAPSAAVRQGVWVGAATGLYGISFGALSVAAGLSVAQTCALSLLMFTGGSQFAFVGVVAAGGTGLSATAGAALLGVRNAFYGLQTSPLLGARGLRRLAAAQLTIDESTAVAVAQDEPGERRRGFWAAGLAVFGFWNAMTLLGALLGDALGDPRRWGLDGAAAAAFLALLWPRLRQRRARAVGALAALVAVLLVPAAPAGVPVLAAAVVAVLVALLRRPRPEGTAGERGGGPA
ncbi:putative branched-subunit amino acid permease [Kineococcus xinjiangensis]|uniref:Putative branched-subunit amino acid permease n=1 Tax=Kineococcus xinjiangensis TaxID=512762 RepID=A0A2S6IV85_9ACTN|nr:AzlC family ABC transporter permease [Kineococcus xinjiangensis]PPK97964.1 putative branched-subunit amino acid permease [Kineococcus xinjiangensis]